MTFDDVYPTLPRIGWLTPEEGRLLWDLAQAGVGDILEIGTYCGKSATLLSRAILGQPSRRLYCCDPFISGFDGQQTPTTPEIVLSVAEHLLKTATALQVHVCWTTQEQLHEWWDKEHRLSLVYVDGEHSYEGTLDALRRWAPLADNVAMHDYGGHLPGVKRAADGYWKRRPDQLAGRIAHFKVS